MGHVANCCLIFKICVLILVYVNGQHSVNDGVNFKYVPNVNHLLAVRVHHDCYMYNTTQQEQHDMHDTLTMIGLEAKVLKMIDDRATYFKTASKDHYKHDLRRFNHFCQLGNSTLWVFKGHVF
ncbi:uncharacterized protein LOC134714009 [Mytilus trossulus]|uniref:uncharacterized protein LOC134714009 n=1 Tax=Mytilus trossulus TaxID=6551 RepID=UPI003007A287